MDLSDLVYVILLVFSIGFGHILRSIDDKDIRRNVATSVGFLLVTVTSGYHTVHLLIVTFANWAIFRLCPIKKIHVCSFLFTFAYLIFSRLSEYFGIPRPPSYTNLIQMIFTLKVIGLAFEIHDSENISKIDKPTAEHESCLVRKPNLLEMIHYLFCYMGILAGPYYSYRVYCDFFEAPFSQFAQCKNATLSRLRYVPLYSVGFLISSSFFPLKYVLSEEYGLRSLWYRLWYILPTFFTFRMRMYIGMHLAECGLVMAGMGAYPVLSKPCPAKGPTTNFDTLSILRTDLVRAKSAEYNFDTVNNIEPYYTEFTYSVRTSMKYWNMTVQYWLAQFVYKRFPNKKLRMPVTFIVSSLWHGIYGGHYMCLCSVPFYLPIEDAIAKRVSHLPSKSYLAGAVCFVVAYLWRMLLMGYWGDAFSLLELKLAFSFWASVYFLPTFISLLLFGFVFFVPKVVKRGKEE